MQNNNSFFQVKKTLLAYPVIWFDCNTMAMLIDKDRKTVSRAVLILAKAEIIERRGRYFKLFIKSDQ